MILYENMTDLEGFFMSLQIAKDEYAQALRRGHKEYRELIAAGRSPHPIVLDDILEDSPAYAHQEIGVVEVPTYARIPLSAMSTWANSMWWRATSASPS